MKHTEGKWDKVESFCQGFLAVKMGFIKHELSVKEIEKQFPPAITDPFTQGMIDGLANDSFRYLKIINSYDKNLTGLTEQEMETVLEEVRHEKGI
jgi:hypothetical protein